MKPRRNLDDEILALLEQDARASNREISRQLDVSEGTVRHHLKRLIDARALKFGAMVAPEAMNLSCTAFVRLAVSPAFVRSVSAHLVSLEAVTFVGLAVGLYDVVAVVIIEDRQALHRLVQSEIERLPGVTTIDVREHMTVYKHRYSEVRIK